MNKFECHRKSLLCNLEKNTGQIGYSYTVPDVDAYACLVCDDCTAGNGVTNMQTANY
jgi:hypothetical protein